MLARGGWGWASAGPRVDVGLLVCELGPVMSDCRTVVILRLVFTHWWLRLVPRLESFLAGRARAQRILGLVPAHLWV